MKKGKLFKSLKIICLSALAVFILTNSNHLYAQPPAAKESCNCAAMLDQLVAKIESNYIGYHLEYQGKREPEYHQSIKQLRKKAETTPADKCIFVLHELVKFLRDGHLFVQENPTLTDDDIARLTSAAEQTNKREEDIRRYLDANKNRLDPIEGLWYNNSGQRFGIIRDYRPGRRDFIAVLLSTGVERWQPGQVKAEFKKLADGSYDNVFYSGRHYPLHLNGYARGQQGGAALRRDGLILHIAPITWGKSYPLKAGEQNLIDPVDPRRPRFRAFDETTVIISVPSHSPEYKPLLKELVEKFRDQILKSKNLIIDVRGDEGGGTGTTDMLMPFLATKSKRPGRYWPGAHTMVLSSPDNISYFRQVESQGWIPKHLVERLAANPGKVARFSDPDSKEDDGDETAAPVTELPQNVAILMDSAVVSAGEAFIIQAMKNKKVTLFGENSGGVLDYQSVSIVSVPGCTKPGINLGYPMFAASEFLPRDGIRATGIAPDVRLSRTVKDPYRFIVNYYTKKH